MPRLGGDIPYRLLGGGQPTLSCTRNLTLLSNPQSEDHHSASILFNGVGDAARLPLDQDIGIGGQWSVMLWASPGNLSPVTEMTLFEIHKLDPVNDGNAIKISISSSGEFNVRVFSSAGVLLKRFTIAAEDTATATLPNGMFPSIDNFVQIVCTFGSNVLTVYRNGLNITSLMTKLSDLAGVQTNTLRSMSIGSKVDFTEFFQGYLHQVATWNKVLSEDEIRTIWNQGAGSRVTLKQGQDGYNGQDNLQSWYKLGLLISAPAADFSGNNRNMAPLVVEETLPTGMIVPFGGSAAPAGFLLCDGSAVSRTTFAALFAVIGTQYGVGDGSTTFNLPNLQGKTVYGLDSGDSAFDALGKTGGEKEHTLTIPEMPSHDHNLQVSFTEAAGNFAQWAAFTAGPNTPDAIGDTGGDQPHNNMPPYQVSNWIIQT